MGALPAVFSPHLGGSPFAVSKIWGIRRELGGGERRYREISPYPETSPGRGRGNRYESPPGRVFWLGGDFEAQVELVLPNPLEMAQNQSPAQRPRPLSTNKHRALLTPR